MDEQNNPKKVRRVGSVAFALVLILAGVLLLIYQLVPNFNLLQIFKFSPVILIVLGIEMLVYNAKPDTKVKFDWMAMIGCAFILCVVGAAALLPIVIDDWSPETSYAQSRIANVKTTELYDALNVDTALKSRVDSVKVSVVFNRKPKGDYTLQDGDTCEAYIDFVGNYPSTVAFASDCMGLADAAKTVGFTAYRFSLRENDADTDVTYYLDVDAAYMRELSVEQLAQHVTQSYHYDGSSFDSKQLMDNYIKDQLREEVIGENDDTMTDSAINAEVERRFAEKFGQATPETAQE